MHANDPLQRAARRWPEREALRAGDEALTFDALDRRVNRLARMLIRQGAGRGDRIATFLENSIAQVVAEMAILRAGAVWVAINRRLAAPEVGFMLEHSATRWVITDADGIPDGAAPACIEGVVDVGGGDPDIERRLDEESDATPDLVIDENDVARLRYTSGTTGVPKAAVLTHRSALTSLRSLLAELHDLGPDDVVAHVAPLTHASEALLAPAFWRGARSVLVRSFEAESFAELIARERVTTTFLVPTMIGALAEAWRARGQGGPLKTIVYGAAPMPAAVLADALAVFGPVLLQIYGMSECPFPITTLSKQDHFDSTVAASCGLPTAMNDVRIVDGDGRPVVPGDVGRVAVRGPQMMREYWRDAAATAATIVDGWLLSTDLGSFDERGFLTLVDRRDDVIISGGFNVYPREVECVLEAHPAVLEAAVAGVPHPRWGQGVTAWVVSMPDQAPVEAELIDFCRQRLAGYKKPLRITFVPSLPKSSTGKVLRRRLREAATPFEVEG